MVHTPLMESSTAAQMAGAPLTVWRVDGGDDALVDIVAPLLSC
jgi:hypothetical protein